MQSYFLQHNDTFQNSIDALVPKKWDLFFICGTNTGPAATSQTFPKVPLASFKTNLKKGKGISLLWQFKSNFTSRMVSKNRVRKNLCVCVCVCVCDESVSKRDYICGYQKWGVGEGGIGWRWSKGTNF